MSCSIDSPALEGQVGGLSLTEPNRGIIIETCVELMDGDEDEDCGDLFGKTLTESTEAPSEPSTPDSRITANGEEPRQLLLLLSSRRVETALRATLQLLQPRAQVLQLSQRKVLKVLAQVHFLWKLRHAWAQRPEESWGLFLQGVEAALLPSTGLSVHLVEGEDWRSIKNMCTQLPAAVLSEMMDATLRFYHSPKPKQLMRLTNLLQKHL